jgi:hypothetical protein
MENEGKEIEVPSPGGRPILPRLILPGLDMVQNPHCDRFRGLAGLVAKGSRAAVLSMPLAHITGQGRYSLSRTW